MTVFGDKEILKFGKSNMMILGFDPGKDKCGIAIIQNDLGVEKLQYHQVIASDQAVITIEELAQKFPLELMVMGNQTTAKQWYNQLVSYPNLTLPIVLVDERNSTLEARELYWQMYPPKGLQRLIPQGMRLPPRPIDDLVAILLIKRYLLARKSQN
jgi:RNase H-fold protein (predicted Holliday junction resolvase)